MAEEKIYAEHVNYWKTSRKTTSDGWIEKAKKELQNIGGNVIEEGFIRQEGKSAFLFSFVLENEQYKMIWPVLQSQYLEQEKAAKVQASTALYYEVKNTCVKAKFLGTRVAFIGYLMIDDGRTISQLNNEEFQEKLPEAYKANVLALPVIK